MEYKNLETSSLIDKCVDRVPLAWVEFIKRFSPIIAFFIKKALFKYSGDRGKFSQEIKDIEQDIMTSLWSKNRLAEIKNRKNINYWLAITARNTVINYLKTNQKEMLLSDKSYFEKLPAIKAEKEVSEARREAMEREIKEFYNLLSPKEKLVFNLYFRKNLSLKEISKIMRIPLGTVSSIVTRMRQKIKCSKI